MGTKDKERRVYPKECKAEAVAPAGKHEKPVRPIAADLGVNENRLQRWIQQAREAGSTGQAPFPGRPRDQERARLRKEVESLREAAVVIFAQTEPR